jgi:hypothetical protein
MTRDPLAALTTSARLWLAITVLILTPTGDQTSLGLGLLLPGTTLYGDCGYSSGPYCTPDMYLPGSYLPGQLMITSLAGIRLMVTLALIGLVVVALRRRTLVTRRVAQAATVLLAGALVLTLGTGSSQLTVLLIAALVLTGPPVWRAPRGSGHPARLAADDGP